MTTDPVYTMPREIQLSGYLGTAQEDLRIGDKIDVSAFGLAFTCIVVEISRENAHSPIRWRAEGRSIQ